jgi:endo-1,4-beta-xylanase
MEYFNPMLERGTPNVEMHIYGSGRHGGSIEPQGGIPFGTWPTRYLDWLKDLGFLSSPGTETKAAKDIALFVKKSDP